MGKALAQGCSLVVLQEPDSEGQDPEIVGGMILAVQSAEDPDLPEVSTDEPRKRNYFRRGLTLRFPVERVCVARGGWGGGEHQPHIR